MNAPFGGPLGSVPRGFYSIKKKNKASPRGQPEGTKEGLRAARRQQPELCDNREREAQLLVLGAEGSPGLKARIA